jgi:hypothetical protein
MAMPALAPVLRPWLVKLYSPRVGRDFPVCTFALEIDNPEEGVVVVLKEEVVAAVVGSMFHPDTGSCEKSVSATQLRCGNGNAGIGCVCVDDGA